MRGFTLVELLVVLIVLGIISLITVPIIINNISSSQDKLREEQIKLLENNAEKWAMNNTTVLSVSSGFSYCVTIEEMKKEGLLTSKEIVNPKTGKEMNGCINITYDEQINQFIYNYVE